MKLVFYILKALTLGHVLQTSHPDSFDTHIWHRLRSLSGDLDMFEVTGHHCMRQAQWQRYRTTQAFVEKLIV